MDIKGFGDLGIWGFRQSDYVSSRYYRSLKTENRKPKTENHPPLLIPNPQSLIPPKLHHPADHHHLGPAG